MRLAIALLALSAQAGTIGVVIPVHAIAHPKAAYHAAQGSPWDLVAATVTLESMNGIDYATTYRGVVQMGGCERNPLLVSAPCTLNVPRFTGIKIAGVAFGVAQWIPVWIGHGGARYQKAMTLIDYALAAPLSAADANNVWVLTHWRK
jgi:hypothetical protein